MLLSLFAVIFNDVQQRTSHLHMRYDFLEHLRGLLVSYDVVEYKILLLLECSVLSFSVCEWMSYSTGGDC